RRGAGDRDQQVGVLPPVRRRDRDRARAADVSPPGRPGPGRVHGRRRAPAWSPWASTSTGPSTPLAIEEGSTENATLVTDLITGLRDRGLDVTRPVLAVLDGAKALSRAVKDVFDKPLFQRRQQHKIKMQGTN